MTLLTFLPSHTQLSREYEDSKEIDFFRRYGMLKAMIKRSIMHLTLSKDDRNHILIGNTAAREKEEQKKRDERLAGACEGGRYACRVSDHRHHSAGAKGGGG